MPSWIASDVVIGVASGSLGLIAIALALRWRFAPRAGDTPYCRRCRYNLTGVAGENAGNAGTPPPRCPECGATIVARAVVRGERVRRRGVLVGAVTCALLAVSGGSILFTGALTKIDWYRLQPTSWILSDLDSTDDRRVDRALDELATRVKAGTIASDLIPKLAEKLLDVRRSAMRRPWCSWYPAGALEDLRLQSKLDERQLARYWAEMAEIEFAVRPRLARDESFKVFIREAACVSPELWVHIEIEDANVDGENWDVVVGRFKIWSDWGQQRVRWREDFHRPLNSLGKHVFTARVVITIRQGADSERFADEMLEWRYGENPNEGPRPTTDDPVLYRAEKSFALEADSLDRSLDELITLKRSPEFDIAVQRAVRLIDLDPEAAPNETRYDGATRFGSLLQPIFRVPDGVLPVCVSMSVSSDRLPAWESDYPPTFFADPVTGVWANDRTFDRRDVRGESTTLRLRPCRQRAAETPQVYEIWGGELIFDDVPINAPFEPRVGRVSPTDATTAPALQAETRGP